jgi:hypothetical protein
MIGVDGNEPDHWLSGLGHDDLFAVHGMIDPLGELRPGNLGRSSPSWYAWYASGIDRISAIRDGHSAAFGRNQ